MLPTFTPDGAGHMVFAYRRTSRAFADALTTIGVEWSTDLAGPWMPGDGTHGETITVDEDAAGPGIDVVQVSIPLPTEGRLFARLRVVVADGP
jgi:hypothetical protein